MQLELERECVRERKAHTFSGKVELITSNIRNPDQNISNTLFRSRRSSNCVAITVSTILEIKGRMEQRL